MKNPLVYIPQKSFLHSADPISKMLWIIVNAILMLIVKNPLSGALLFLSLILVALFLGKVPVKTILNSFLLLCIVALPLGLFQLFLNRGQELFHIGSIVITDNGLIIGGRYFFRIATITLNALIFLWTTDIREFMGGLVALGVPYQAAFAVFVTLRFIPMVMEEVATVKAAHSIRGSKKSSLANKINLYKRYLFTVLVNGIRKAETTSIAMECRGFGAHKKRTLVQEFHWSISGLSLVIVFLALAVYLIWNDDNLIRWVFKRELSL